MKEITMVYFGVLLGLTILTAMVFLALNKKSTLKIRIAALAALGLMILTIVICLFIIFTDNRVPVDASIVIVGAVPQVQETDSTPGMIIMLFFIFMIAFFVILVVLAMKEHRKHNPKKL
jgi:hypothetical protein